MRPESVLLQTAARFTFYLMMMMSLFLYWRGHNEPGGGFVAGLMASGALVLQMLAFGIPYIRKVFPVNYHLIMTGGLFLGFITGAAAMLVDYPFLTSTIFEWEFPIVGHFEFPSAALFDLGVFLTVVGATTGIIMAIGEDD